MSLGAAMVSGWAQASEAMGVCDNFMPHAERVAAGV